MTRRRMFLTEYRAHGGGRYGGWIWAINRATAIARARERGLREKIVGETSGSSLEQPIWEALTSRKGTPGSRLHALCFFALLALKSKAATPERLFDDSGGLIHEWAHYEVFGRHIGGRSRKEIVDSFRRMAQDIPGYCRIERHL